MGSVTELGSSVPPRIARIRISMQRSWLVGSTICLVAAVLGFAALVGRAEAQARVDSHLRLRPQPMPNDFVSGPSNCPPDYCGVTGDQVSLRWYYPLCGEQDCGTETWFCKFLSSKAGTCKVDPKQTTGTDRTTITVTIAKNAPPGRYSFELGADCSNPNVSCLPADVSLFVKPEIKGEKEVWFFNHESVKGYTTDLKLTAKNDNLPANQYQWTITDGSDFATFVNDNTNPATLFATDFPPQNTGDLTITVSANGATSDPFMVRVKRPYRIVRLGLPDDHGLAFHGYQTFLHYEIRDQFDEVLPNPFPAREVFTTGQIDDRRNDWLVGTLQGYSGAYSNPADFKDNITGQFSSFGFVPHPEPKAPPACHGSLCPDKITHFCGYVVVGGVCELCGVMVATLAWQRFRDHGRHCNLISPSASPKPNQGLPACPGPNATSGCLD